LKKILSWDNWEVCAIESCHAGNSQDGSAGVPTFVFVVLSLLLNGVIDGAIVKMGTARFLKTHPKPTK